MKKDKIFCLFFKTGNKFSLKNTYWVNAIVCYVCFGIKKKRAI